MDKVGVSEIVEILLDDETLIDNWKQLADSLGVRRADYKATELGYKTSVLGIGDLLERILDLWVRKNGIHGSKDSNAIVILSQKLKSINFHAAAGSILLATAKIIVSSDLFLLQKLFKRNLEIS
jgi:hypothetical protein